MQHQMCYGCTNTVITISKPQSLVTLNCVQANFSLTDTYSNIKKLITLLML